VDPGRARPRFAEPVATAVETRDDPSPTDHADEDALPPIPWHVKLLAGAVAVYLGWRAYQGIEWLVHHL
jgi:hypothetical protein